MTMFDGLQQQTELEDIKLLLPVNKTKPKSRNKQQYFPTFQTF